MNQVKRSKKEIQSQAIAGFMDQLTLIPPPSPYDLARHEYIVDRQFWAKYNPHKRSRTVEFTYHVSHAEYAYWYADTGVVRPSVSKSLNRDIIFTHGYLDKDRVPFLGPILAKKFPVFGVAPQGAHAEIQERDPVRHPFDPKESNRGQKKGHPCQETADRGQDRRDQRDRGGLSVRRPSSLSS
eukprot:TRINITY_DN10279_c0_g1_i2.p1 TRINITY_DN10279_c0_g1~~TRINITY_DN10279_c0_g1_i2.p1  ORF type:complete len:183 (+),score=20.32 TRINITY_DN10279_c0_g1_i2:404-952(+)